MPLALLAQLAALAQSQSGGLPDTNARIAVLEATVTTLQTNWAAETAARQAADTALQNNINNVQANITNAINSQSAARQAPDAALQNSIKNAQNAINSESATRLAANTAHRQSPPLPTEKTCQASTRSIMSGFYPARTPTTSLGSLPKKIPSFSQG
jgi:hypothetical protein